MFCQFGNKIQEYIIINDDGDRYTLEGHFKGNWFSVTKDKCFSTRDDLKFNNFKTYVFNIMNGKKGDGSVLNEDDTKEEAKKRALSYLHRTKQTTYKDRFMLEYSEYLV